MSTPPDNRPVSTENGLPLERLLTKRDAADVCGVCPRSIDNFISRGELRVVRLGTRTMIDPRDLREFIESMKSK
jgi:hypothetical protein